MPSFYAIIPANVRYDNTIPANAKLLYGEITALCSEKGYCWATNRYFAELYDVSVRTISMWINALVDKNYISSEVKYKKGTKEVESRWISIAPHEKNFSTSGKKLPTPIEENFQESITVSSNTNDKKESDNKSIDILPFKTATFLKAWEEWIDYRRKRRLAKYADPKAFFDDLIELSNGDEETAILILKQSRSKNWQGIFALKQPSQPPPNGHDKHQQGLENARRTFKPIGSDNHIQEHIQ